MYTYTNGSLTSTSKDFQALNRKLESKIRQMIRILKGDLNNIYGSQVRNNKLIIPNDIFLMPKVKFHSMVKYTSP